MRPNILWIQTDEQRPDLLGCYGSPRARTPHVDALASSGTLFHTSGVPVACLRAESSIAAHRALPAGSEHALQRRGGIGAPRYVK